MEPTGDGVDPRRPALWDGKAGQRVAQVLLEDGYPASRLRPTDVAERDQPPL